mgnify:CR=1 FL=1
MEHKGTVTIETPRLLLRRFTEEDIRPMHRNWANDPAVTEYLTWQAHKTVFSTKAVVTDWITNYARPDFYQWAIELKLVAEPVGTISVVRRRDDILSAELGWCLGKLWWGKGIMPEAANAVMKFLFEEIGVHRITACHDVNNPKSGRVMQKIGMSKDGILRANARNHQGTYVDMVFYSIVAEDYFAAHPTESVASSD